MKKILEVNVGSHLYGVANENSDKDIKGVFLPSKEYIIGLNQVEQIDENIVEKDEYGRNTKNAIDKTYFEYRHFLLNCIKGNPNFVEILFTDNKNVIYADDYGKKILKNKNLFISKNIVLKMLGFATSMEHKLDLKNNSVSQIIEFKNRLNSITDIATLKLKVKDINKIFNVNYNIDNENLYIGNYKFTLETKIAQLIQQVNQIYNGLTIRRKYVEQFGYEVKSAYHYYRLLSQCEELLVNKTITYPLVEKDLILKIKNGEIPLDKFKEMVYNKKKKIEDLMINCELPKTVNFNKINDLCMEELRRWLK